MPSLPARLRVAEPSLASAPVGIDGVIQEILGAHCTQTSHRPPRLRAHPRVRSWTRRRTCRRSSRTCARARATASSGCPPGSTRRCAPEAVAAAMPGEVSGGRAQTFAMKVALSNGGKRSAKSQLPENVTKFVKKQCEKFAKMLAKIHIPFYECGDKGQSAAHAGASKLRFRTSKPYRGVRCGLERKTGSLLPRVSPTARSTDNADRQATISVFRAPLRHSYLVAFEHVSEVQTSQREK